MALTRTYVWPVALAALCLLLLSGIRSSASYPLAVPSLEAVALRLGAAAIAFYVFGVVARRTDVGCALGFVLLAAWILFGRDFRGSHRWLDVPQIGLVPIGEIALATVCLCLGRRNRSPMATAIAIGCVLGLAIANSKSYALFGSLVCAVALTNRYAQRTRLAVASGVAAAAWAALWYSEAGARLRDFYANTGPSRYTEKKLDAIRSGVDWTGSPWGAEFPWPKAFVFDDFTLLWDLWHLGIAATLVLYGLVFYFASSALRAAARHETGSAIRLYGVFVLMKSVGHAASCFGLMPVIGVSAPFVTASGMELIGVSIVLCGATCIERAPCPETSLGVRRSSVSD